MGRKVHNLNSDALNIALTNTAPVNTNTVLANITQITAANGYSSGGTVVGSTAYSQTAGVGTLTGSDVTFTASGGNMGPFRYAVLYNATASGGPLIAWVDYGSSVTLASTGTFVVDFGASILTVT
jgi:hypothetical protein